MICTWRAGRLLAGAALMAAIGAGCGAGGHTSSPTTSSQAPSTTAPITSSGTSSGAAGPQTSGPRTVLSPTGLNVRGAPSSSAPVLGSAARGAVLTVLGYTTSGGGWFQVKGATVTGWISAQPTLSAPGEFQAYSSSDFAALYPATWTESAQPGSSPASVVFRPASGAGDIMVTAAGSVSQLPHGRAGYGSNSVSQVVACGTTAGLVVYRQAAEPLSYLAEVRFAVDAQHALGLYADMPDLGSTFQIFKEFVASLTFSAPQCSG